MIDRTDMDVRFLNHVARVEYANQFGALYPAPRRTHLGPRRFVVTLLLRLSIRLAPEHVQQTIASTSILA